MASARTTICRGIRPNVGLLLTALLAACAADVTAQVVAPSARPGARDIPAVTLSESLTDLDSRWALTFDASPSAAAGFDATAAFVPLRSGELVAVDLDTGTVRWSVPADVFETPATGEGLVFAGSRDDIAAFDARTGEEVWRAPLPGRLAAPLHWDTGWLIASTEAGDLAAFRAQDGTLVWRQGPGSALVAPPAPALDKLYLAFADGRLVAVALATGTPAWEQKFTGRISGLMALDDQLVVGTTGNEVYSLDLERGRIRWRWRVGADVAGAAAADERHIYFVARDNLVRAVDRRNGNLRWSKPLASRPASGPIRVGTVVLVPYVSTQIAVFVAETGQPLTPITVAGELGAKPMLRQGGRPTAPRLITISREGTLQGFAARVEPPLAPLTDLPGTKVTP